MSQTKAFTSIAVAVLIMISAHNSVAEELSGSALESALKSGGYVIYLRHAKTNMELADRSPIVVEDCATQRPLSDDGRNQAQAIGEHFVKAAINVSDVYHSPYCRAAETAAIAFPHVKRKGLQTLYYSVELPKDQAAQAADELKKMLATKPRQPGTNVVVVGHTSNLKDAAGVWPKKEGSAVVFRPDGEHFKLVGILTDAELRAPSN